MPMYISIPCGHCSECISMYRSEWRLRARLEALNTSNYVLFDTLTYSPGALPHLSDWFHVPRSCDFPCFSRYDVTKFFKLLRTRLSRMGYDVKDKLRYILCSEYGNDIRYTRRPHYHVLFFVNCELPPKVLSRCISSCWPHGRTDGYPYRSLSYIVNRNVFKAGGDIINPVIGYVSKYISKSFAFNNLVTRRLSKLKELDFNTYIDCQYYVRQFHVQSKGFGYNYLLQKHDVTYYVDNYLLPLENKQHIVNYCGFPKSLVRKLFYRYTRDEHGRVSWLALPLLVDYKCNIASRQIDKLSHRLASVLQESVSEIRRLAELLLFAHDRLLYSYVDVRTTLKDSFNIDSGLRNYCCHDKGMLIKRPVFANCDYGGLIDGLCYIPSAFVVKDDFDDPLALHTVDDIKRHRLNISGCDDVMSNYIDKIHARGDTQLPVMRLLERLNNVHKTFLLC